MSVPHQEGTWSRCCAYVGVMRWAGSGICRPKQHVYIFTFHPTSPPSHNSQVPILADRCIHKPVLCTSLAEAVCGRTASRCLMDLCSSGCLADPVLHCIIWYLFLQLYNPISTHCRKNIVIWIEKVTIVNRLKILDPQSQPVEGHHMQAAQAGQITCSNCLVWNKGKVRNLWYFRWEHTTKVSFNDFLI